jgi:hypothetical protein
MDALDWAEVLPRAGEVGGKPLEFLEVQRGKHFQSLGTLNGQMYTHHPMVIVVSSPSDQTRRVSTVDEPDSAVVQKEQVISDLANSRATRIAVSPYRQQQLMLGRREPRSTSLALAPTLEMAKPGPQGQQSGVDLVR